MKISRPAEAAIDAEVDLGTTGGACFVQARLNVSLRVWSVKAAHQTCAYSKATRGNIDIRIAAAGTILNSVSQMPAPV